MIKRKAREPKVEGQWICRHCRHAAHKDPELKK